MLYMGTAFAEIEQEIELSTSSRRAVARHVEHTHAEPLVL